MVCPDCAKKQTNDQPLHGVLDVIYEGNLKPDFNTFDLLPVSHEHFPPIPVGNTPLWEPQNLRSELGFSNLYIKDDGLNPTGSLKDRASYLVAAFAKKHDKKEIVLASTGNAGSSMAGIGASSGISITLFLPKAAPKAKIVQAMQYGANVIPVDGNYDFAFDMSLEYSKIKGVLNRNTAYNPLTIEGKKTVALEIYKQLKTPCDNVFIATGDGVILSGIYKGFRDLLQFGLIEKIPTIYSVQAETSDALYRAFNSGKFENKPTHTVADSICVDVPRNGFHALNNLKEYNGKCITVTDAEILKAQHHLASKTGLFTEPAGATSFAGFLKMKDQLNPNETTVLLATGNGLKDTNSALKGVQDIKKPISSVNEIL